jgi:flotillin
MRVRRRGTQKKTQLSKAVVDCEMKVQQANWELYNHQKAEEELLFEQQREAKACRTMADVVMHQWDAKVGR